MIDDDVLERVWWRSCWDIIGFVPEPYEPPPCPGEGNCHGCLAWCEFCGSVSDVCHVKTWPNRCDTHERWPEKPTPDPRQLWLFPEDVLVPAFR